MGVETISRRNSNVTSAIAKVYPLYSSEQFSTAGRSVKTGLVGMTFYLNPLIITAAAVVSSWTWAATLLQSSGVAYRYGVSGPFCTFHVLDKLRYKGMQVERPFKFFYSPS
jgi:hypothetical protein